MGARPDPGKRGRGGASNLDPGRLMRPAAVQGVLATLPAAAATHGLSNTTFAPLARNGEAMAKVEFHFDFGSPNAYLAIG